MKLNLGCGKRLLEGYLNVDRTGEVDLIWDLEQLPWPWPDNSVAEVRLIHVLEHLGGTPASFCNIIQELYRVCQRQAAVLIIVPHHRHDSFYADPTHVRPITEETIRLLSRCYNLECRSRGFANSCLALDWQVDFELKDMRYHFDPRWQQRLADGGISKQELFEAALDRWNVIENLELLLQVVKPGADVTPDYPPRLNCHKAL